MNNWRKDHLDNSQLFLMFLKDENENSESNDGAELNLIF